VIFQATEFDEDGAQFSPDGRWIAYGSDESGRYEVYVREFSLGLDGKPEATAKHQVSNDGGIPLRWRDDGKELIYLSLDRRTVTSAEIATRPVFQVSPAKALFQLPAGLSSLSTLPARYRRREAPSRRDAGQPKWTAAIHGGSELAGGFEEVTISDTFRNAGRPGVILFLIG
jgi:hypothetical protein